MASEVVKDHVYNFTHATATVDIFFPENIVKCYYCKYIKFEYGLERYRCLLTDRIIYSPHSPGLPEGCPAKIEETE